MYSAIAVANYFLDVASRDSEALTPMKIQKLVYIAHGWHLGLHGEPLITEPVEAWRWGPVFPSLYHEFKKYGREPITGKGTEGGETPDDPDEDTREFLNEVWKNYQPYTGVQLANLTHEPKTPWDSTIDPYKGKSSIPTHLEIKNETIREYYKEWAEQED